VIYYHAAAAALISSAEGAINLAEQRPKIFSKFNFSAFCIIIFHFSFSRCDE